jgi:hypothetical protein
MSSHVWQSVFLQHYNFDLLMSKRTMNTFGQALPKDLIELLWKYNLREKNCTYVKDEGSNF